MQQVEWYCQEKCQINGSVKSIVCNNTRQVWIGLIDELRQGFLRLPEYVRKIGRKSRSRLTKMDWLLQVAKYRMSRVLCVILEHAK